MRYGILADIHGNLEALETVLDAMADMRVERYLCVGDVVGYGADPKACIDRVREVCDVVVAGNHDWAVAERISPEFFNPYARDAIEWTQDVLDDEDIAWLGDLPLEAVVDETTLLVHSTVHDPQAFDYLLTSYDAFLSMKVLEQTLCFVGHSHIPITFLSHEGLQVDFSDFIDLGIAEKVIVNPGSVGQPRDDNPHAAYAVYDTDKQCIWLERMPYDIDTCTSKIEDAGLPQILAERLRFGK